MLLQKFLPKNPTISRESPEASDPLGYMTCFASNVDVIPAGMIVYFAGCLVILRIIIARHNGVEAEDFKEVSNVLGSSLVVNENLLAVRPSMEIQGHGMIEITACQSFHDMLPEDAIPDNIHGQPSSPNSGMTSPSCWPVPLSETTIRASVYSIYGSLRYSS